MWKFIEHATNFLARPRAGDPRPPTLWPSEACAIVENNGEKQVVGKCRRSAFLSYTERAYSFDPDKYAGFKDLLDEIEKYREEPDDYMRWIWDAGELYEEHLINIAKNSGVFINEQVPIYIPKFDISGKIDIIVINPETGKLSIVEAKSVYGHGRDEVIGKPFLVKPKLGTPKESNLMQVGIYHWWYALPRAEFEYSRLVYGARDTGIAAEYLIDVKENSAKELEIYYKQTLPIAATSWTATGLTINSIFEDGYKTLRSSLEQGQLPARDYDLQYTDDKLMKLYHAGELPKSDTEKFEKLLVIELRKKAADQLEPWEADLVEAYKGKRIKEDQKPVERGDWQCRFCNFTKFCYDKDKNPRK